MIRLDTGQYLPKISVLLVFQLHVALSNDINKATVPNCLWKAKSSTENQIDDAKDIDDLFILFKRILSSCDKVIQT